MRDEGKTTDHAVRTRLQRAQRIAKSEMGGLLHDCRVTDVRIVDAVLPARFATGALFLHTSDAN